MSGVVISLIAGILVGLVILYIHQQYKQWKWLNKEEKRAREKLEMSKRDEEKAMKEALELFEKELNAELDKIAMSDNPFEALLNIGKEKELDPVKDFNKILTKPKGEHWQ